MAEVLHAPFLFLYPPQSAFTPPSNLQTASERRGGASSPQTIPGILACESVSDGSRPTGLPLAGRRRRARTMGRETAHPWGSEHAISPFPAQTLLTLGTKLSASPKPADLSSQLKGDLGQQARGLRPL